MKIAIVVDHLEEVGGVERWLAAMLEVWPQAHVFTPFISARGRARWRSLRVTVSSLQRWVDWGVDRKLLAPIVPLVMGTWDLSGFDVVLSSHAWFATSIVVPRGVPHVCYCHTPPRLLWGYPTDSPWVRSLLFKIVSAPLLTLLRLNDYWAAQRVTQFVTNSHNVGRRIRKFYRREAEVVPCAYDVMETENNELRMKNDGEKSLIHHSSFIIPDSYYLVVSRLVAYKNVDIAVQACSKLSLPLVAVGDGPERDRLEQLAGPSVRFTGLVSDDVLRALYRNCRAVIFPCEDDFGNVPVEAMQAGKSVIAFGRGGVLETVIPGKTGEFFTEPTAESLCTILTTFEPKRYAASTCRKHGEQFSRSRFLGHMRNIVEGIVES